MAIALAGTPVLSNSGGSTATSMTATLGSTTVGALNIIAVSANTTGAAGDPAQSMPAGWTAVPGGSSGKTGSPWHRLSLFYRFYQAGDTNPTVSIAFTGNIECAAVAYTGVDATTPFVTGEVLAQPQGASSTSWSTGSITTAALRWIISVFANRTNGTWSALTDTLRVSGIIASSANIAYEDSNGTVAAGTITARTATFSAATSVGNTVIVALNPSASGSSLTSSPADSAGVTDTATIAVELATNDPAGITDNATAVLSGTGTAAASDQVGVTDAVQVVQSRFLSPADSVGVTDTATAITPILQWVLSASPMWVAHRGGFASTLGEETLEAYTAAAAQYSKAALEISVWDTSDGVYVCSHDSTTGRVFSGTNYTINSTTWATLSPGGASTVGRPTTINGGNPLRRLEEILDAFPTRLFVVENKHGTNQAALSTLLDGHAPGRWMFKGPYNDTANANIAAGHGVPMWLFFYPSQLGSLSTAYSAVSSAGVPVLFGLGDYSAAPVPVQTDATTFFAFTAGNGIKTWAHILATTTQRSTADSQASTASAVYDGYMTQGFAAVAPSDAGSVADPVGVTDGATTAAGTVRGAVDQVGLADAAASAADVARPQADPVGLTDAPAATTDYARPTSDPVGLTDAASTTAGYAPAAVDPLGLTDAATTASDRATQANDAAGVTDNTTAASGYGRAPADPLGVTDAASTVAAYSTSPADTLGLADSLTVTASYATQASDPVGLTDAAQITYTYTQTGTDAVGLVDSVTVVLTSEGAADDLVGVADTATAATGYAADAGDALGVSDAVTSTLSSPGSFTLAATDSVGLSDVITAVLTTATARDLIYSVFTGQDRWHVTTSSSRWTVTTGAVE